MHLKKYKINASLTCIDLSNINKAMKEIDNSDIYSLHYDVVDGKFNTCFMFGDRMISVFKNLSKKPIMVHLACEDPTLYIPTFIRNKADGIIIHYESNCDVLKNLKIIKQAGGIQKLGTVLSFVLGMAGLCGGIICGVLGFSAAAISSIIGGVAPVLIASIRGVASSSKKDGNTNNA